MARLRSKIWVQAYLKRLEIQNIAAYVTAHGDDHSGAILIKVIKMDGSAQLYQKTFDLQSNKNLPKIYIEKETDLYKNIFLYLKVIENASEIHCLDSSFLHLVERVKTNAELFFHNIKNYLKLYVKHLSISPKKHLIFTIGFLLYQIRIIRLLQEGILVLDQVFIPMEHKHLSM